MGLYWILSDAWGARGGPQYMELAASSREMMLRDRALFEATPLCLVCLWALIPHSWIAGTKVDCSGLWRSRSADNLQVSESVGGPHWGHHRRGCRGDKQIRLPSTRAGEAGSQGPLITGWKTDMEVPVRTQVMFQETGCLHPEAHLDRMETLFPMGCSRIFLGVGRCRGRVCWLQDSSKTPARLFEGWVRT